MTRRGVQDQSGVDGFQFRLARDPDFSEGLIESDWWFADWTPPPLAEATTYWWSVRARDPFGNVSEWAYPFQFTTVGQSRFFLPLVTRQ